MKYLKMKRMDILIIILVVLLSLIPTGAYAYIDRNTTGDKYLSIQINAKEVKRVKLTGNTETYTIPIEQDGGERNIVLVDKEQVSMKEANCPDKLCTLYKPISKNGETITCLPHKVVLQIVGGEGTTDEGDVISY